MVHKGENTHMQRHREALPTSVFREKTIGFPLHSPLIRSLGIGTEGATLGTTGTVMTDIILKILEPRDLSVVEKNLLPS